MYYVYNSVSLVTLRFISMSDRDAVCIFDRTHIESRAMIQFLIFKELSGITIRSELISAHNQNAVILLTLRQ
jgi:hypothetical protein